MSERTEITTPEALSEDQQAEPSLRPQRLAEFIGQDKVRDALRIAIKAANQRREPLDHTLFHGPPGLGKTTLASLMARELGVNIKTTSGPILEKPADEAEAVARAGHARFRAFFEPRGLCLHPALRDAFLVQMPELGSGSSPRRPTIVALDAAVGAARRMRGRWRRGRGRSAVQP